MFVFSRSVIQKTIDNLAIRQVLSQTQLEKLIVRLNEPGIDRLAASWELSFLHALSELGKVDYELPSPKRAPDIIFTKHNTSGDGFVADVTVVSDAGLDESNPIDDLITEVARLARKLGLDPNKLSIRPEARVKGYARELLIPKRHGQSKFVNTHVVPFLRAVKAKNTKRDQVDIKVDGVSLSIGYDVEQRYMQSGYASYKTPVALRKNPLWNALHAKAAQLRAVKTCLSRGVIICDGGCEILKPKYSYASDTFKIDDIIGEIFRSTNSMDFVVIVGVDQVNDWFPGPPKFRMSVRFFEAGRNRGSSNNVERLMRAAVQKFPTPISDPVNAAIRCRERGYGLGHHGAYRIEGGQRVKISSRALLDLLGGKLTSERFHEMHGWPPAQGSAAVKNPFARNLAAGRMISKVEIDKGNVDDDDEWLVFEFGPPHPAISPFVARRNGELGPE